MTYTFYNELKHTMSCKLGVMIIASLKMEAKIMKIKVYIGDGYRVISVSVGDSVKTISNLFARWEYIL